MTTEDCATFESSREKADLATDVLEWLREHEPWRYSVAADELYCFFCDISYGDEHDVQRCIWKRAQTSQ